MSGLAKIKLDITDLIINVIINAVMICMYVPDATMTQIVVREHSPSLTYAAAVLAGVGLPLRNRLLPWNYMTYERMRDISEGINAGGNAYITVDMRLTRGEDVT